MPNHAYLIIAINRSGKTTPGAEFSSGVRYKYGLLSKMIKALKHELTRQLKNEGKEHVKWQRSFYDHIMRDERTYLRIKEYMANNPVEWGLDAENIKVNGDSGKYYKKLFEDDKEIKPSGA
jgi:REP element-mobilizing transposase RayT